MEIFHQCFQYTPSQLFNVVSFYNLCMIFEDNYLKIKLFIDIICSVLCRIKKKKHTLA